MEHAGSSWGIFFSKGHTMMSVYVFCVSKPFLWWYPGLQPITNLLLQWRVQKFYHKSISDLASKHSSRIYHCISGMPVKQVFWFYAIALCSCFKRLTVWGITPTKPNLIIWLLCNGHRISSLWLPFVNPKIRRDMRYERHIICVI